MYSGTMTPPELHRVYSPALNRMLGQQHPVLHDGFVRVVDYMGADESIVQAARVSYGKGTKKIHEDAGLIRYLMRHRHTTPFEMCELKLHVRVPMDAWRQWIRHRTANVNEYSTRYSEAVSSRHAPQANEFRIQAKGNRQGSDEFLDPQDGNLLREDTLAFFRHADKVYQSRLSMGVAREQAREVLPLCTYTEAYWKIDLHNLLHFLALRMDKHAQFEIRSFANVIGGIVEAWVPMTWAAFQDYRVNATHLTARDAAVIRMSGSPSHDPFLFNLLSEWGWVTMKDRKVTLPPNRERTECEAKLDALELPVPWRYWPDVNQSPSVPSPE